MKKYLVAGLLVWLPLAITIWVLSWMLGAMDGMFASILSATQALMPESARAGLEQLRHVPGLGVLVMVIGLLLTGVFAANIFGQWWLRQWDAILGKIPIVKSIYNSVKQVSDTLFSGSGVAFRKVLLVRYPHPEAWSVAFQTGHPARDVADMLPDEHVGVFIPTTPSPVNGFFFFVKRSDVIELDMNVDEALKYIVSMGVVAPPMRNPVGRAQNQ